MRKIVIILLALGALVGFGSGIWHGKHRMEHRRQAFERHVAELCVDAARRANQKAPAGH